MEAKIMRKFIIIAGLLWLVLPARAQLFYNNGAVVQLTAGALVQVNGSLQNANAGNITIETASNANLYVTGNITNDATMHGYGNIHLNGNWINNNNFQAHNGTVFFEGANQLLTGSVSSSFYNLSLLGTGIKTQGINQTTSNILALNDRELATAGFTMFVTNTSTAAITRTSGFVSSTGSGKLSRNTASASIYLFPVGSSSGTLRYRPVELTPASAAANTYVVRMANVDASSEGYNRSQVDAGVCQVNPFFYHRINRTAGADAVDMRIYFDETTDGSWDNLGQWHVLPSNLWYRLLTSTITTSAPLSYGSQLAWNNFSDEPYALVKENIVIDLGNDTAICAGTTLNLDAGAGYAGYSWSTGAGAYNINVNSTGDYSVTVTEGSCTDRDTISIVVNPLPLVDIGNDTTVCDGFVLLLDAGNAGSAYAWNTGPATQTINAAVTGSYSVTVTDGNLCWERDTLNLTVLNNADASITADTTLCSGDPAFNLTAIDPGGIWTGTGVTNGSTGAYNPGAGPGNFEVIYTIAGQCGDADSVTMVIEQSLDATIASAGPYCIIEGAVNLSATDPGGLWSGIGITDNMAGTFDPATAGPGSHTITYTLSGNCGDVDNIVIVVNDLADATITTAGPFCSNDLGQILQAVDPGGVWSGTGISNPSIGTFNPSLAIIGDNEIIYSIAGLCGDADTILIHVNEAPDLWVSSVDETCDGANDGIGAVVYSGGVSPYSLLWENGESTDSVYSLAPGYYGVLITDANGCRDMDTITIDPSSDLCYIPHIYVPNIFSPNGDGQNDVLFVRGDGVAQLTFVVYDRWGEKVFESSSLSLGWDGTYKGAELDPAVFSYYVKAVFENADIIESKGNVTLIR